MQNGPNLSCGVHALSESWTMIGHKGWENIDLISALDVFAAMLPRPDFNVDFGKIVIDNPGK